MKKLNTEIVKIMASPAVAGYLAKEGAVPKGSTPAELAQTIKAELAKWGKVIASARIKLE